MSFAFRFRTAIFLLLYLVGFLTPWAWYSGGATGTTWLALTAGLASTHWLSLRSAGLAVTSAAVLLAFAGAAMRVWGAAWLGTDTVFGKTIQADRLVAGGPYRYVRNPLYLGTLCYSAAIAVLMPPSGTIVFLIAMFAFVLLLIYGEESHLDTMLGVPYRAYCRRVPRLLPRPMPGLPAPSARPQWLRSAFAEIGALGVALSFGAFAWRYNTRLLAQAIIVSFGLSLVARALVAAGPRKAVSAQE